MKPWFLVTFSNIISHIFPEHLIEIHQVIHKIWRYSFSILIIFIDISDFLTGPSYKEANDVSILLFLPALIRLFNNSIKLA